MSKLKAVKFFWIFYVILSLITISSSPVLAGQAILSWDPNAELDLAGYKVYYGTVSNNYTTAVDVGLTGTPSAPSYTVANLTDGITYYFAVTAYDDNTPGNESGYSNEVSKIITDTTPPVISAILASNITSTSAVISWTTNEAATSQVEYGTTTAYGSMSELNSTLVTSHSRTLSGLQPSTLYHYRVRSADASGNLAISGDNTFTTSAAPDTTPPIISGITASNITDTGAVITWATNEAATSQVEYGTTTTYGFFSALNSTFVTSHSRTLSGLLPFTTYHFRVLSRDAAGNLAVSGDNTFTTSSAPDTTPPADVLNFSAIPGDQQVTLSWTNPPDSDFVGVRIVYRTDRFPNNINDGTLLGDFTGQPNAGVTTLHNGLQNGVTYYYIASSYDGSGNFQSTVFVSATPQAQHTTSGGGCGMIFPKDGRPPGPGQPSDMMALAGIFLIVWIKKIAKRVIPAVSGFRCPTISFKSQQLARLLACFGILIITGTYITAIDTGNEKTHTIRALPVDRNYFIETAFDKSGNESDFPKESRKTIIN